MATSNKTLLRILGIPLLIFALLQAYSCSEDKVDCSLVLCAGNDPIYLEILLEGENALANGTFTAENISLDAGTVTPPPLLRINTSVIGTETAAWLEITYVLQRPEDFAFILKLGDAWEVPMEAAFSTRSTSDPCCSGFLSLESLTSEGFSLIEKDGYYTLVLE